MKKEVRELRKPATYISLLRLVFTGVLYWAAWTRNEAAFIVLLLLAGLTDALDGYVARKRNEQSEFGAKLDSVIDYVAYGSMVVWLYWLHPELFRMTATGVLLFTITVYAILKFIVQEKKFLHLWPSKVAAVAAYAFVLVTVALGVYVELLYAVTAIVVFATAYELYVLLWRLE